MTKINVVRREQTWGDTAVDGLLAGLIGGVLMTLFLALVGWAGGAPPQATVALFDPAQTGNWLSGLLAHLAVSAIYGLVLALLLRGVRRIRPSWARFSWLLGLAYGLLLYGVVQTALATGIDSGLVQFTAVILLIAHAIYGLVLGIILGRK